MVGSPARTDEESSRQQQANRIAIEDGADINPPPAFATRDLLRPVGRAIVSIRVISTTTCEHNSLKCHVFCVLFFFFFGGWWVRRGAWLRPTPKTYIISSSLLENDLAAACQAAALRLRQPAALLCLFISYFHSQKLG